MNDFVDAGCKIFLMIFISNDVVLFLSSSSSKTFFLAFFLLGDHHFVGENM